MGYRLEGDSVAPINQADIISEPVALGSVEYEMMVNLLFCLMINKR